MRLRQRVIDERFEPQPVLEKLLAAEVLVIGVLDPALAQHLIGQVIGVLEDGQPGHQSRRQRRMAGIIRVDLAEATFQEAPIHRPRQRDQWMLQVDDLIEPGAKQFLFTRLSSFPWPHLVPRQSISRRVNHESNLQGIPFRTLGFLQIRLPQPDVSRFQINDLGILHGRLLTVDSQQRNLSGALFAAETVISASPPTIACCGVRWRATADEDGHYCFAVAL
jgi:hypothetical protein